MPNPNASYSVTIQVEIDHRPGALGRLTTAIGAAGGNILGLDIVEVVGGMIVRDVTVLASDEEHVQYIKKAVEAVEGVTVRSVLDRTFRMHVGGKLEVASRFPLHDRDDLSMAYTPGVARVCLDIARNPEHVHRYTIKSNSVAVVTDGTAVLGLGSIGPEAALPVMEGKAVLFKEFAGIDAFPICLRVDSAGELIDAVRWMEPVFGGINLEDIAAPRCFEVEAALTELLDIPVFHDDQHGTAVVVLAALRNALEVVGKSMDQLTVVMSGAGAAGVAISNILGEAGVPDIVVTDRQGAIYEGRANLDPVKAQLAARTNPNRRRGTLPEVISGADLFIGVSGPGVLTREDVMRMAKDPVVFALANPDPEIHPEQIEGVAAVVATGRSDYPNQINNVLCFPGVFRGAIDVGARRITEGMKVAAAEAIAGCVSASELSPSCVVPSVFNKTVVARVAQAVGQRAVSEGVVRP
jgi:malate dehydrogenase (oxaloacetate-decarboxylating)